MIQVILGSKGSGKTLKLIDMANTAVGQERGNIFYIDHNNRHMHDLKREIRLVNAAEYAIDSPDTFYGLLCGMLSANFDITLIVVDGFLKILYLRENFFCCFFNGIRVSFGIPIAPIFYGDFLSGNQKFREQLGHLTDNNRTSTLCILVRPID